jgi:hypothetical protein
MKVIQDALVYTVEIARKPVQRLFDITWAALSQRTKLKLNPKKPAVLLAPHALSYCDTTAYMPSALKFRFLFTIDLSSSVQPRYSEISREINRARFLVCRLEELIFSS